MAIDGALRDKLEPETKLVARYKGKEHQAEVVAGEDGKVRFRLADGREFRSPSAAGSALMNGIACNGWRFWSIEGQEPPAPDGESRTADVAIKRTPNQRAVPDGETRYFCEGCRKSFNAPTIEGGVPERCPEGHKAKAVAS